ncbi:hypothetical protein [Psychrobacter celer]|uniref:hypothetical protein n=1 Tax=Psychrobacter celer TaxID=306572 RepID=UPI003FD66AC4
MPKVNNTGEVTQEKLGNLISETNLFLWNLREELCAIKGDIDEYAPPINFLKEAHETAALQPKIHGLLGVHLMIMMIKNGEKNKVNNDKLDKMVWDIGDFLVKLMTDI